MAEPLRHRQTKEAATDMLSLQPPRHIPTLPRLCETPIDAMIPLLNRGGMMKGFVQGADRQQTTLLPECLDDWVDESNSVRAVDVFVDALELRELGFDGVTSAATGRPGYHPSPMLKLYIYGYLNRVQSSRRLEREAGRSWFHEIKYDGYRLRIERDGDRVRLITRGGYDWTGRYPWIAEAARRNRIKQFVLDGEAVVLCVDGMPDFNALHSRKYDGEVQLCAF